MLNSVSERDDFPIHVLHLFLDFVFQEHQSGFLLFTVTDGLTNLLIVVNVTVCQNGLQLFLVLRELLLVSAFFESEVSQLLFFLLILASSPDTCL